MTGALLLAVSLLLVRHGERDTTGPDTPLNAAGRQRAERIAAKLSETRIDAVYATTLQRTQQTVAPTAVAHHLQIKVHDANDTKGLVELLKKERGTVLVAGHSDTLPEIAKAFGCDIGPIAADDFDGLFVVSEGVCIRLRQ